MKIGASIQELQVEQKNRYEQITYPKSLLI